MVVARLTRSPRSPRFHPHISNRAAYLSPHLPNRYVPDYVPIRSGPDRHSNTAAAYFRGRNRPAPPATKRKPFAPPPYTLPPRSSSPENGTYDYVSFSSTDYPREGLSVRQSCLWRSFPLHPKDPIDRIHFSHD